MSKKPNPKSNDPEEYKRFLETARKVEARDPEALERALKKIAPTSRPKKKS